MKFHYFQTVKKEGITALYKGFIPAWIRMGPWNIIFFVTYEQLKKFYQCEFYKRNDQQYK